MGRRLAKMALESGFILRSNGDSYGRGKSEMLGGQSHLSLGHCTKVSRSQRRGYTPTALLSVLGHWKYISLNVLYSTRSQKQSHREFIKCCCRFFAMVHAANFLCSFYLM